jgi:hypothetical protein
MDPVVTANAAVFSANRYLTAKQKEFDLSMAHFEKMCTALSDKDADVTAKRNALMCLVDENKKGKVLRDANDALGRSDKIARSAIGCVSIALDDVKDATEKLVTAFAEMNAAVAALLSIANH